MGIAFKTNEELIEILNARGVITNAQSQKAIERESYYAIINGYKSPFLDYVAMEKSCDDVYKNGTQFKWIYDLFMFDRDLRSITFKYLTRAEAIMRTAVVYAFCHNHPVPDAYLNKGNYCSSNDYLVAKAFKGNKQELYHKNLKRLMSLLRAKTAPCDNTQDFIKHYVQKYNTVPLWVLANDLNFGNIVNLYQLMQRKDRREACSIIARTTERSKDRGTLSERKLLRSAKVLNQFRNLCAHDERLYCAKRENADYKVMISELPTLLPVAEVHEFLIEVGNLFNQYQDRLPSLKAEDLLSGMGFEV